MVPSITTANAAMAATNDRAPPECVSRESDRAGADPSECVGPGVFVIGGLASKCPRVFRSGMWVRDGPGARDEAPDR
ncbi:hypothetical protein GOSPT_034_00760 [Gordonia sputi NBRC 100414]|uniref:Uncharacterized protein n=1 Tax=Gordonia sputi NBRC 100414 TaxID=1089453 RepID=H5TXK0_9ACTN|nr:hypothetical protein GOSPT_034_00760 [Gordonia sputi NBRC 100414]